MAVCGLMLSEATQAANRHCPVYGHRGARGLLPENSLRGYALALELGVDFVDMDVVMTRDRVVVVHHDLALNPDIDRDASGEWVREKLLLRQMDLVDLQTYDIGRLQPGTRYAALFPSQQPVDGTRIPTLEEVIDFLNAEGGDHTGIQIEIKDDPEHPENTFSPQELAIAIAEILHRKDIVCRTEIQAFNWQILLELEKLDPAIHTAFLTDRQSEARMLDPDPRVAGKWSGGYLLKDYGNSIPRMIKALGGTLWDPEDVELTQKKINEAHAAGLKVVPWSDPEASGKEIDLPLVKQLIAMGVDGIITDRPDRLVSRDLSASDISPPGQSWQVKHQIKKDRSQQADKIKSKSHSKPNRSSCPKRSCGCQSRHPIGLPENHSSSKEANTTDNLCGNA